MGDLIAHNGAENSREVEQAAGGEARRRADGSVGLGGRVWPEEEEDLDRSFFRGRRP